MPFFFEGLWSSESFILRRGHKGLPEVYHREQRNFSLTVYQCTNLFDLKKFFLNQRNFFSGCNGYKSILRAYAHNEGFCVTSDNARRTDRASASISCEHCLVISRIVCIGTYSILFDFGAYTSFYAYTRI